MSREDGWFTTNLSQPHLEMGKHIEHGLEDWLDEWKAALEWQVCLNIEILLGLHPHWGRLLDRFKKYDQEGKLKYKHRLQGYFFQVPGLKEPSDKPPLIPIGPPLLEEGKWESINGERCLSLLWEDNDNTELVMLASWLGKEVDIPLEDKETRHDILYKVTIDPEGIQRRIALDTRIGYADWRHYFGDALEGYIRIR